MRCITKREAALLLGVLPRQINYYVQKGRLQVHHYEYPTPFSPRAMFDEEAVKKLQPQARNLNQLATSA